MIRLKSITTIFLLTLLIKTAVSQEQIDHFLLESAENNPELQRAFNEYQAALERVTQEKALPDPQLTFGYYILPVETRVGPRILDLSLTQKFPWFGTLAAKETAAREAAEAKLQAFEAEKYRFFYEAKKMWYRLFLLKVQAALYQEHMHHLKTIKELALTRYEAGQTSMVDVLRAEMEINEIEVVLEKIKERQQALKAQLNLLVNRPVNTKIPLPEDLDPQFVALSKDAVKDTLLFTNPELAGIDHQIAAAKEKIRVSELKGLPDLSVGLNYGMITPRDAEGMEITGNGKDILMPKLSLNIPLNRKKYKAGAREAEFMVNALESTRTQKENRLLSEMEETYTDYLNAQKDIKYYREQIRLAEQAYEVLLTAYTAAEEEFEELIMMQHKILNLKIELYEALIENNTAVAKLEMLYAKNI